MATILPWPTVPRATSLGRRRRGGTLRRRALTYDSNRTRCYRSRIGRSSRRSTPLLATLTTMRPALAMFDPARTPDLNKFGLGRRLRLGLRGRSDGIHFGLRFG